MASSSSSLNLIERIPQTVRLTPADVDFLLSNHRSIVQIQPTGRSDEYQLAVRGVAGVIAAPGCWLVIAPKIPLPNLFFMLAPDEPIAAVSDHVTPRSGLEVLNFLAGQLAARLRAVIRAGLHRGYVEKEERGRHLHGRLDLPAQLRQGPAHREQIHSRYDELTADLPCNQAPRAVAERLLVLPGLEPNVAAGLREGLLGWAASASRFLSVEELTRLAERPARPDYQPLLELCLLLWQGLAPGEQAGDTPSPTFLLDLERVFERYLTRGLSETAQRSDCRIEAQRSCKINLPVPGQPDLLIRPDVLILRDERPVQVVDAKWKRLKKGQPETGDLYQMLAYCTTLGVDRAALVYPGRRDRAWTYQMRQTPVVVAVHTLTVTATPAQCRRSLQRLGRAMVRRWPPEA